MRCAIPECDQRADPDGGVLCLPHRRWTASRMRRCLAAIERAIADEDGLDGADGEPLLRELGHWPSRTTKRSRIHD